MHGNTIECLKNLMARLEATEDFFAKRRQLADILEVEDATVRRWVSGSSVPHGMSLIGLRYYLDLLGYEVSEIKALPKVYKDAGRILAFRVMSLDDMARLTAHENHQDAVLAVLRGVRGLSVEREQLFQDLVDSYTKELIEAMARVPRIIEAAAPTVQPFSKPAVVLPVVATARRVDPKVRSGQKLEHFKMLTLVLLDYARDFANPEVSEEARDQLREVVGQGNIFDLKNLLSRLCSSKAFSNQQ